MVSGLRKTVFVLGVALITLEVQAQQVVPSDQGELVALLDLLDEQTDLATRTGMNADYTPGMASVLNGDELLIRGARTVWDALGLVPGISLALDVTGERQVLSRGVGHGYSSGNIKVLLDGVSMNSTLLATANAVLDLPIEQIERIEVIRGPGSSLHGEYAYAGVINVITRGNARRLMLQLGEDGEQGAGLIWHWEDAAGNLAFSLNAAGLERDSEGLWVERDALLATGESEGSNAPGPANSARRQRSLFADLRWRGWFASLKLLDDQSGDYFGINHFLPPDDGNLAARQREQVFELGHESHDSARFWSRWRLEARTHEHQRHRLYVFPAGYLDDAPVFMDRDYREQRYLATLDLHWRPHLAHQWLLALEASHVEMETARWSWSGLPFELAPTWLDPHFNRQVLSLILQDEFRPRDRLTLTATLRYDRYSDAGTLLSPRAAAVWRPSDSQVVKVQYARAFRPPTFYELSSAYARGDTIDPARISTWELGYLFKQPRWEARLILFHSELMQPVLFDGGKQGYANGPDVRLRGLELEYQHRLSAHLKLDANLSLVDAEQQASGEPLAGGAEVLANLALLWRPRENLTLGLQVRHTGERVRYADDPREPIAASTQCDLSLSYRLAARGINVSLGVKNLTDADVRYPDQITGYDDVDLLYPDGYPAAGRRWWLSVGMDF